MGRAPVPLWTVRALHAAAVAAPGPTRGEQRRPERSWLERAGRDETTATTARTSMHPPLVVDRHPQCEGVILELRACHAAHPAGKFWGACNDAKAQLDACFRAEKRGKQRQGLAKAKAERERLQARIARTKAAQKGG